MSSHIPTHLTLPSWLPAVPYPPTTGLGFWSPVTSTLNWCEEDYYASHYIAELVNSLTNLWFVYLGYKGIRDAIRNKHDTVFLYAYILYLLIGLNSLAFHATLKFSAQLGDELAMIYTTCIMVYAMFAHGRSLTVRVLLGLASTGIAIFVTGYYLHIGDPKFHQRMFALLTAIVFFRSLWVMEVTLRPSRRAISKDGKQSAEQARRDRRDQQILTTMYNLIIVGMGSMIFGFFIWTLDNKYCGLLRRWRHDIGLPWGLLLEGHGWWHFFTGIAGYYNIIRSVWLRYCLDGKQDEVEFIWPSLFTVPVLERKDIKKRGKGE